MRCLVAEGYSSSYLCSLWLIYTLSTAAALWLSTWAAGHLSCYDHLNLFLGEGEELHHNPLITHHLCFPSPCTLLTQPLLSGWDKWCWKKHNVLLWWSACEYFFFFLVKDGDTMVHRELWESAVCVCVCLRERRWGALSEKDEQSRKHIRPKNKRQLLRPCFYAHYAPLTYHSMCALNSEPQPAPFSREHFTSLPLYSSTSSSSIFFLISDCSVPV